MSPVRFTINALFCLLLSPPVFLTAQVDVFFDTFTGRTLRFDYYHSGTSTEEYISLDRVRLEGPWSGSRTQLIDQTNRGKYLFEVIDQSSGYVIYSRGYASIYGEWETTGEARDGIWRTFHESQRFPETRVPVLLVLKKRNDEGGFIEIYHQEINPVGRFVDRSPLLSHGTLNTIIENGTPASKVDILFMGDGYTIDDVEQFQIDTGRLVNILFNTEPYRSRRDQFNVRTILPLADQAGISDPRNGVWRNSPLGLSHNALDLDRYVLTYRNTTVREIAAQVPYDILILVSNSPQYGGGGIFNLYAVVAASNDDASYLLIHEFGHAFAGLGDEYYNSDVTYEEFHNPGVEPWEPNITALLDPVNLKWRHLVDVNTPLPTPWDQTAFDQASQQSRPGSTTPWNLLEQEPFFGVVGAFEGASYEAKGLYRPELSCIMFSSAGDHYCQVCTEAIEEIIDLYTQ
ncbi:M64 family metallopeptidase [Candidatus Neomarinimicrobiota bacterium]